MQSLFPCTFQFRPRSPVRFWWSNRNLETIVFASSHPNELSLEDADWKNGAFTEVLQEELSHPASDYDKDGLLSVTEMELYLSNNVTRLTQGQQHPVTKKDTAIGDINFARILP